VQTKPEHVHAKLRLTLVVDYLVFFVKNFNINLEYAFKFFSKAEKIASPKGTGYELVHKKL